MEIRKIDEKLKDEQTLLTIELAKASDAYYNTGVSIMSDMEFDKKLEILNGLEERSGFAYDISPSVKVGADVVTSLEKSAHEEEALSLDKIKYKNKEDLIKWAGDKELAVSWKLDGITVVITYDDGKLTKAVTRGNAVEGNIITHNARYFEGVPLTIPYKGHLVVRGEAIMSYDEFERINAESGAGYENPRNLASSSAQMLDSNESKKRHIMFKAFKLVIPKATKELVLYSEKNDTNFCGYSEFYRQAWLASMGFSSVEIYNSHPTTWEKITKKNILDVIEWYKAKIKDIGYPTDGIVISYDDQVYADSLGNTGKHPRGSIAMKWTDETEPSTIRDIEWSVGKTGTITPVAIFDTVRLGVGSNVSRASLHNISILENLPLTKDISKKEKIKIGSKVEVYLANMIIPQIASIDNDGDTTDVIIPPECPVCGGETFLRNKNGVQTLVCVNASCPAKQIKKFATVASRDGLNIDGLSEKKIEYLLSHGYLKEEKDFYTLKDKPELLESLATEDGWGSKSVNNLLESIEKSRKTDLKHFLYSLSIPLVGHDLSKKLDIYFSGDIDKFIQFIKNPDEDALSREDGIGPVKAGNIVSWCRDLTNNEAAFNSFAELVSNLEFKKKEVKADDSSASSLSGKTFVITGAVHTYKNRDEFKASVEARGGKVSGSVSSKTTYLVNNDTESTSGKNKKAKELGIPVISEDVFIEMFGK